MKNSALEFGKTGCLAPGVHPCSLDQLKNLVVTNDHRRAMWYQFISFLAWPIMVPRFSHVYIGGGFVSCNPTPRDMDVVLQTKDPYGPEAFAVLERFFLVGLPNIKEIFSIDLHFWIEGAPEGLADYRVFFQYGKPAARHPGISLASKGVAQISLEKIPEMRKQLKKHLLNVGAELSPA